MSVPKVSIVSICFNQEAYIKEALDSFVMQNTNFDFEVVIADDCSTDRTAEIISEYADKYPKLFSPILRKKNVGIVENLYDALCSARGKYITLCEGDDYWTDPNKLQTQADFMDNNPDYALCFHPVKIIFEPEDKNDDKVSETLNQDQLTTTELLKRNYIYTNSIMYRKQNYTGLPSEILPVDWYLHLFHARFGKIGYINKAMSVYRRHPGGVWWESDKDIDVLLQKQGLPMVKLYIELLMLFDQNNEYKNIIYYRLNDLLGKLFVIDKKYNTKIVASAVEQNPSFVLPFVAYQITELIERERTINLQKQTINEHDQTIKNQGQELKDIKSSKLWRARNNVVVRKLRKKN